MRYSDATDGWQKTTIFSALVNKAQEIVKDTKCASTLRLCQSVLIPARVGASLEETAAILGVGRATIPLMQKTFRIQFAEAAFASPCNWGRRRHQLMSPTQEKDFFQPWLATSAITTALSPPSVRRMRGSISKSKSRSAK